MRPRHAGARFVHKHVHKLRGAETMEFIRVGDKVIGREKLTGLITEILRRRSEGATQQEVAEELHVERSFVSHLERLGEVRRGNRVALVGFPIGNLDEVKALAEECGVEFVYVLSESQRRAFVSDRDGSSVFNDVLDILARLRDFDTVVLLASDWRIKVISKILGREVVGVPLGKSPIKRDKRVNVDDLRQLLLDVMAQSDGGRYAKGSKRKPWLFKKGSRGTRKLARRGV